ncbi:hypothetical protein WJX82_001093 [Trebouxia sp. C0006]
MLWRRRLIRRKSLNGRSVKPPQSPPFRAVSLSAAEICQVSCLPYMPPASSVGPDPSYLWQRFLADHQVDRQQIASGFSARTVVITRSLRWIPTQGQLFRLHSLLA